MSFLYYFLLLIFLFVCVLLSFVVLLQDSKSMGLGASFGGDAGDIFGTSTADVLKKFTAYLAVIFMGGCLILSLWTSSIGRKQMAPPSSVEEVEKQ